MDRRETECGDDRQMVAEPIEIAWAEVVASRFHATIFLVGLQQKGCVVDVAVNELPCRCCVAKYMVETAPETMIAVCAFCAVSALRVCRHFHKAVSYEMLDSGIGGVVVEVSGNDNASQR